MTYEEALQKLEDFWREHGGREDDLHDIVRSLGVSFPQNSKAGPKVVSLSGTSAGGSKVPL